MDSNREFRRFLLLLLLTIGLLAGCMPPAQPQPAPNAGSLQVSPAATSASITQASFVWRGPAEMGGADTSQCASLHIQADQVALETCDGVAQTLDLEGRNAEGWAEIQARFAPFVYETPTESIVFNGTGMVSGEVWQRALLAWARTRYAELSSGRVSAATPTVMSWHLGQLMDRKNTCRHLTVLAWGYATAETIMCEGQDVMESAGGWLEQAEMAKLDEWLYAREALYQESNYIAGTGAQPMSEAEVATAGQWAEEVWARLWAANTAQPGPADIPPPPQAQASVDVAQTDVQFITALVNVNIRSGPGTDYQVIGQIFAGQTAQVTGVAGDGQWWRVICPDGAVGDCYAVADPTLTQPASERLSPGAEPSAGGSIQETGAAVVESLDVQLLESFPVQANAILRGYLPDGCTVIDSYDQVMAGPTIRLRMTTRRTGELCIQVLTPFEQVIPLNVVGLPAGEYDVRVNELIAPFSLAVDNVVDMPPVLGTEVGFIVAQSDVNIHTGPGVEQPVIGFVAGGMTARVTGVSEDGQWWRVICPDGTDGSCWVSADPALTQPAASP